MLIGPFVEGGEDENDQSLALCDQNDEMDIYPALNSSLADDALPASLQSTPMPDIEMYEATELVNGDEGGSDEKILDEGVSEDGGLAFMAEWLRPFADESPIEKPAAAINDKDYVYVRTLMPVAPEDLSKIEQVGKGTVKFIGDEHVMTYGGFLCHAKIIRSDTREEMNLLPSEKKKIYSRDGRFFLMDSGKEMRVETCPFERPPEKPVATINEEDYIYVRTLTIVAQEDISKIEEIGKGKSKFIGDEHMMTYGSFLDNAKIIQSDTQEEIDLSRSEKRKIYCRNGRLFLPMDLGKEIEVETCPFERPPEKPVATINKEDYVYVRTLTPVEPEDLSKIEEIGKVKFINDEHVMTYKSFLSTAKIIRSDTQAVMALSFSEKKKIYSRDGRLFLPRDSGEEIKVEARPIKRPDKKRKHEDITKHNESEDADIAAPAAKRKKAGEVAKTAIVSRNKNRFFRKKLNIHGDKNCNTEDEDDYDMGEVQNGPR